MRLAFISDLHLCPQSEARNQVLYNLLSGWKNELDGLYILGDFFDFWCGDDDDNSFIRKIKQSFQDFTQSVPIYFITGNHDFALSKGFAKATGITLIKDMTILKLPNTTVLLSHGDAFCSLDIAYQRSKLILQNPITMSILRMLPLAWRYKIKDKLEHKSAQVFNTKPKETYHIVDATVCKFAKRYLADTVIHGHTHNPGIYSIKTQDGLISRLEIPDWADRAPGGYIMFEDGQFTLHYASN